MNPLSGIRFGTEIAAAAERRGLDPRLMAAVAAQETGGPDSNSGANVVGDGGHGRGLFQIDDRYHAFAQTPAAMDPAKNADYAAGLLSGLLDRYHGDVHAALSAYNAGSPTAAGTTTTWSDGRRLGYADSVLRHLESIEGTQAGLAADNPENVASVNALADYAGSLGVAPAPRIPASVSTEAAPTPPQAPAPQVPQWTPPQWQFRSFQSELQAGGGATGSSSDAAAAGLVDPMAGDGGSKNDAN
jgi:hypothetical protein